MTNRGKKQALALCLSLALLLGLLPAAALADDGPPAGGNTWTFTSKAELESGYDQTQDGDTIILDYSDIRVEILEGVNGSAFQNRRLVVLGSDHPMRLIATPVRPDELEIRSGVILLSGEFPMADFILSGGTLGRSPDDDGYAVISGTFDYRGGALDDDGPFGRLVVLKNADSSFVNHSGQDVRITSCSQAEMIVPAGGTGYGDGTVTAPPTGDFTVDGLTITTTSGDPVSRKADGQILLGSGTYAVSGNWSGAGTLTGDSVIRVPSGKTADVTLNGVSIDASGADGVCAFNMTGATVNLTLADGSDNVLKSGRSRTGLEAPVNSTLTIGGSGALAATGGDLGAGIGGTTTGGDGTANDGGTITIRDSARVTATGGDEGAGIGGASLGGGGTITIQGSARVTATGGDNGAAGIGGGYHNTVSSGTITIGGGARVTATGGDYAAGIGSGDRDASSGVATGAVTVDGDAVVFAVGGTEADDIGAGRGGFVTKTLTKGVVFEGISGTVYGGVTLPGDLTIPDGSALEIPGGATLTNNHTLTNDGTIDGSGILTGGGVFTGAGVYTLKVSGIAPPTLKSAAQTSVTLNAVTLHGGGTAEYARSGTDAAPADGWQIGVTFDGLTAGTSYYFFVRVTGDSIYRDATSAGAAIQTASGGSSGDGDDRPSPTEQAVSKVEKAKDGDTVKLDLPSGGKLPGKALEAAAGKDVTLEIDAGNGVTWIINGKDLPTGKLADLNLKVDAKADTIPVDVMNALTGEQKVMQLALSHNGAFDFPLTLRLETGKENAGLFANLYYYNEADKTLEYQSTAKIGPDGNADLPFEHASSYAVVIDETSHAPVELPFTDVTKGDWCYEAVEYVYGAGLMVGVTDAAFGPDGPVTRAQVWTVLARLDGADTSGGAPWYAPARDWAVEMGVSDGTGPDGPVTQEQLVTMLYRYAQSAGMDVSVGGDTNILSYDDAFDVAEWAVPAFQWACGAGVVSGTSDTTLSPQAGATRAQLAAVLTRMTEK